VLEHWFVRLEGERLGSSDGGQGRTGERTCHSKEDEDEDEKNRVIWRQGMGCLNNKATNMHSLNTV